MKPKYFFLFLLTLTIFHQTSSIATIRYVSKTGTSIPPYTSWLTSADSIQKCINICVDGDTVYVANGVYKENLVINTQIFLSGLSMDSTVLDGRGMGDMTVIFNANVSITNFSFYGKENSTWTNGIIWAYAQNTIIEVGNCKFTEASWGISCVNSSLRANNLIMYNLGGGISLGSNILATYDISNCVIIPNRELSQGISIGFALDAIANIRNNVILFLSPSTPDPGISIGAVKKIYIKNNLISGFRPNIYFDTIVDTSYVENSISKYSNYTFGSIYLRNTMMQVKNNIFKNNIAGLRVFGDPNDAYNLYWKNVTNINGGSLNDSDIVADPMFVNDTIPTSNGGYDFHLQAFSPAIDKGDPDVLDLDGTRNDIGMYGGPFGEIYTYQDLAPLAPRNLSAVVDTNGITLKWNRNTEADTGYYKVYRDTVISFQTDSTKLISSPTDTFFVQTIPNKVKRYVYKIGCVDNQGNESNPSEEVVVDITSVTMDDYPMTINDYLLYQNYPNPFNPSTKIGYKLKERANVKMMVYDIKGELVTVLVNKEQNAGYYEVEFNVGNGLPSVPNVLASGIYLYRIEVIGEGNIPVYTEMKKMLMIK